jgi:glucan phosphoethanolaminetransferase (alkaline phosphatase superfamily)
MSTKALLIGLNHILLMFGTTVYMGVLWALHFFWYPSWEVMNTANVQDHFILPTSAATKFFTIVVPIMFVTSLVLIWLEWRTRFRWHAIIAFLGVLGATLVGQLLIIPVNKTIAGGVEESQLQGLLQEWMSLNDIRWIIVTIMWLALMIYFLMKPSLSEQR